MTAIDTGVVVSATTYATQHAIEQMQVNPGGMEDQIVKIVVAIIVGVITPILHNLVKKITQKDEEKP